MRRTFIVVMVASVAAILWGAPANPATATPSDEIFVTVRRLAILAGTQPPPAISPISYSELESVLLGIDPEDLPPARVDEWRAALETVSVDAANVPRGSVGLAATAEAYIHTGDDEDEWLHWYPDRAPLLSIPIRVDPLPGVGIAVDLDWRKNYPLYPGYDGVYDTVNPDPSSNIFSDVRETDVQFPFYALATAAGSGWSVQGGRSRIGLGLGHTGSLLLSDHVDYHDFLLVNLFGRLMSYRALYLDLEPWLNSGGTDPERFYFAHRIEMRPTPWLSLTANEAMVFHGKPMELRYLNPLMILHSWFVPNYGNSMINLELTVRPVRGLELWAHYAIDQLQSAYEEERGYVSDEPEAVGYLAGAEYVLPVEDLWITFGTEWVFLDPWMYIGRSIMGSLTSRRRVQAENVLPAGAKVLVEKSLGYPSGPDYYGVTGFASLDTGWLNAALDVSYYAKGENDVGRSLPPVDEADATRVTPSGPAPEYVIAARLTGTGTVFKTDLGGVPVEISAGAILDVLRITNNDHVGGAILWDVQFSPHVSVSTAFTPRRSQ